MGGLGEIPLPSFCVAPFMNIMIKAAVIDLARNNYISVFTTLFANFSYEAISLLLVIQNNINTQNSKP